MSHTHLNEVPTTSTPSRRTPTWTGVSPSKYRSQAQVLHDLEKYRNEREAGKLAIALARFTYFGDTVLRNST